MSEGKAANEKYGIEYTVSQEITCTKEIKQLDAKGNDRTIFMPPVPTISIQKVEKYKVEKSCISLKSALWPRNNSQQNRQEEASEDSHR